MSDSPQQPLTGATVIASGTPPPTAGTPDPGGSLSGASAAEPDTLVGTVLADRYRIVKKLGEGGMGSVYLAEHTTINKKLAIKVLSPEYAHKQDLVDRFLQEARAASMIDQQNVVEITDFGSTPSGSVFFVMEYLQGEDLSDTIKRLGPLPWHRVQPIMLQICDALAAAHDAGIIHRDMKPENCYRIRRGNNEDFIKVLDFGIAKVTSDEGDGGRSLTRTGMIFGTPEYMSPEQAKGERVDHRVDVYATGVILYELLTGRVPFTADTFMGILTKHMFEAPPAPSTVASGVAIPDEVEAIILKALQKDREFRFQSMREMAEAIRAVGSGAAPVAVVHEDISTPNAGRIHFSTGNTIAVAGLDEELPKPKTPLYAVVGGVVAAMVIGGIALMAGGDEDAPEPTEQVAVATPEPEPAVVAPPPVEPETKAEPTPGVVTVAITIETPGVQGQVIDGRDDGLLGNTNEPITLPLGQEPIDLYVRAEGYEDELVQVVPDSEKTVKRTLQALAKDEKDPKRNKGKAKNRTRPKTGGAEPKETKTSDPSEAGSKPPPPPKPDKPKNSSPGSPDLKDPFNL